jgi:hypothetical protein
VGEGESFGKRRPRRRRVLAHGSLDLFVAQPRVDRLRGDAGVATGFAQGFELVERPAIGEGTTAQRAQERVGAGGVVPASADVDSTGLERGGEAVGRIGEHRHPV